MASVNIKSENLIEQAENRKDAPVWAAKSVEGQDFDSMTAQDIQKLLVEKEIDESDLLEIFHNNSVWRN